MSHPQPPASESSAHPVAAPTVEPASHEPHGRPERWHDEPEELPRRPRRRLLTPLPLSLLAILLIACGFIGGVLVEKGESSSGAATGSTAGLASRFAALRAGSTGAAGAGSSSGSSTTSGAAGSGSGFTRPTAGTVAYLAGKDLYVTDSEGDTVKVATSPATSVTKTIKSNVKAVHPGETVTIVGATGSNGTVSAESISVGSSAGGLAGLFGRSGTGSRGSNGGSSADSEPALFGG